MKTLSEASIAMLPRHDIALARTQICGILKIDTISHLAC